MSVRSQYKKLKEDITLKTIGKLIDLKEVKVIPEYKKSYLAEIDKEISRLIYVDIEFKDGYQMTLSRQNFLQLISLSAPNKLKTKKDFVRILTLMEL